MRAQVLSVEILGAILVVAVPPSNAQYYNKCRFMACTIVTPTPAVGRHTEHDHVRYDNHWSIDRNMNGTCDPSVNVAVLSFVNPVKLMNLHLPYSDRNLCSAPAMKGGPWLRLTAG